MTKDEALKLALEVFSQYARSDQTYAAITAIKAALSQPEQEPVNDCAPNHFCNGTFVHKPTNELCNKCGKE
jgi:hypothetical protein